MRVKIIVSKIHREAVHQEEVNAFLESLPELSDIKIETKISYGYKHTSADIVTIITWSV